ncbi:MAG: response regulator [Thermodesulfobacteriota bacterium]
MKTPQEMTFLIVDDMDNMRRSIRAMLRLIGYGREFLEASNGQDALEILLKSKVPIDFIISDVNMPKMSGTELLNRVRENKKMRDLPFLMITAEANQEIVAEAAEREVDAYLTKPFVTATLEQKIKELLDRAEHPSPLMVYLRQARDLEEAGEIDGAIEAMDKAAALSSQTSRPWRELGRLHLKKGDVKSAVHYFEQATDINRLDVTSYHYLGQLYYNMGNLERATLNFARAMEISPRHADRAVSFGKLLLKAKQNEEAERIFRLVLRIRKDDLDIKEDIAESCRVHGLLHFTVRLLSEILREDPERTHLYRPLGFALRAVGNHVEAVKLLEKAVAQTPDDVELLLETAKTYLDLRLPIRADKYATRALRLDPQNAEAREVFDKCV